MNRYVALLTLLLTLSLDSYGHEASTAYLYWQEDETQLRLDIALTDVALHLLPETPEALSWEALQHQSSGIARQLSEGLLIQQSTSPCELRADLQGLTDYETESFSSWRIQWQCPEAPSMLKPLSLTYTLLFTKDSLHRAVLTRSRAGLWSIPVGSTPVEIRVLRPDASQAWLTQPFPQTRSFWLFGLVLLGLSVWVWRLWLSSRS